MLFRKKKDKKREPLFFTYKLIEVDDAEADPVVASYTYIQAEHWRGFKRLRLSSYGYEPAEQGIAALSGKDLTGAAITLRVFGGNHVRANVLVDNHEIGTVWDYSFDQFAALRDGKINGARVEIRDGVSYLFYRMQG